MEISMETETGHIIGGTKAKKIYRQSKSLKCTGRRDAVKVKYMNPLKIKDEVQLH